MADKPTSREALAAELAAQQLMRVSQTQKNAALARHTLDGDLGAFSDSWLDDYGLDETTRDRLIAHARQDASHAVITAERLASSVRRLTWIASAILAVVAYIAFRL